MWWLIVKNDEFHRRKQKKTSQLEGKRHSVTSQRQVLPICGYGAGVEWPLNVWKIKLHCSRQVPTVFQNIIAQKFFSHLIPE